MNKNQSGFGIVEVILVLVILAIIGFTGWRVYEANREVSQTPVDNSTVKTDAVPKGWKKYENPEHGFSFIYPANWTTVEMREDEPGLGMILKQVSPTQKAAYDEFVAAARATEGPSDSTLRVSYWKSMNERGAKGGEGSDDPTYASLEDYFAHPDAFKIKQKDGERIINGQKVYDVTIGGFGQSYGVMFQRNDGVYQLEFPSLRDKASLTSDEIKLLDSLKFK